MRIAFIGAGQLAVTATRSLLDSGHDVVIVDQDEERLRRLEEADLDCGLVHGDGSRPAVLNELDPKSVDFLFCVSDSDQDNILAALAGERLGFGRVVAKVEDPDFNGLCAQLGLGDVLVPSQEAANAVTDRVAGIESTDLSQLLQAGLRFFAFAAREEHEGTVGELGLSKGSRVVAVVHDGEAAIADDDTQIREGDPVYVVCERARTKELHDLFCDPQESED